MEILLVITNGFALGVMVFFLLKTPEKKTAQTSLSVLLDYLKKAYPFAIYTENKPVQLAVLERGKLVVKKIPTGSPVEAFLHFGEALEVFWETLREEKISADGENFIAWNFWRILFSFHPCPYGEKQREALYRTFQEQGYEMVEIERGKPREELRAELVQENLVFLNADEVVEGTIWLGLKNQQGEYLPLGLSFYPKACPALSFTS